MNSNCRISKTKRRKCSPVQQRRVEMQRMLTKMMRLRRRKGKMKTKMKRKRKLMVMVTRSKTKQPTLQKKIKEM